MLQCTFAAAVLGVCSAAAASAPPAPESKVPTITRVSGPFTHSNLTVFVLHGADTMPNRPFLTLQEALEQKKIVVHETDNVSQLAVENTSADSEVFLMTGDIVKGGKQDRAIAFDMIVPPKSGAVPIGSFCVEAGRWQQRGGEAVAAFSGSHNQVVGKDLKNAINRHNDQGEVWKEVAKAQQKLTHNVAATVADPNSPSSLQLALENRKVQEKLEAYEKALAKAIAGPDVVGVVFAVNGEFSGAELYGSSALLTRLWPKLLKAAATEALADFDEKKKFTVATAKGAETFLAEAMSEPAKEVNMAPAQQEGQPVQAAQRVNREANGAAQPEQPARVRIFRYEGKKAMAVECQDPKLPGMVIHRSYIAK